MKGEGINFLVRPLNEFYATKDVFYLAINFVNENEITHRCQFIRFATCSMAQVMMTLISSFRKTVTALAGMLSLPTVAF